MAMAISLMVDVNIPDVFNSMNSVSSGYRSYRGVTSADQRPLALRRPPLGQETMPVDEAWLNNPVMPQPGIYSEEPTSDKNALWYRRFQAWMHAKKLEIKKKYKLGKARRQVLAAREQQLKAWKREREGQGKAGQKAEEDMRIQHAIDCELAKIREEFEKKDKQQREEEEAWLKAKLESFSNEERRIFRMGLAVGRKEVATNGQQTGVSSTSTLTLVERDPSKRWPLE